MAEERKYKVERKHSWVSFVPFWKGWEHVGDFVESEVVENLPKRVTYNGPRLIRKKQSGSSTLLTYEQKPEWSYEEWKQFHQSRGGAGKEPADYIHIRISPRLDLTSLTDSK
jgi:galactose-1-phosphate uridylyltransferase